MNVTARHVTDGESQLRQVVGGGHLVDPHDTPRQGQTTRLWGRVGLNEHAKARLIALHR
jgi:hypothetical protein